MSGEHLSKQGKTRREETVERRMAALRPHPLTGWAVMVSPLLDTTAVTLIDPLTHTLFPNTRHESQHGCRDCEYAQGPTLSQSSVGAET